MLPPVTGLGLWILPDTDSEKKYHDTIIKYAEFAKSEPFIPHITLSRVPELSISRLHECISQVSGICKPFELKVDQIACRAQPYQKICLECVTNPEFYSLADAVDKFFGGSYSKKTDPHLSLLYSRADCTELHPILNELNQIGSMKKPIPCTRLGLVQFSGTPADWKLLFEVKLSSPAQV